MIGRLEPDVVLMDLRMPRMGGAAAIRALVERGVDLEGAGPDDLRHGQRRRPGPGGRRHGLPAEGRAARGAGPRDPRGGEGRGGPVAVGRGAAREPAPGARQDALSDRELEVLTLISQGETNRGAAARLFISEATVKTHLLHIYEKLGVNDRAAAVATAYERGLLVPRRG